MKMLWAFWRCLHQLVVPSPCQAAYLLIILTSPRQTSSLNVATPTMDGKRATSAVQPRQQDAYKTPTASKPPRKAATVSAAAVFKRAKLDTPQDRPSAHSLQKSTTKTAKKKKKEEIVHPLALAFKGVTVSLSMYEFTLITYPRNESRVPPSPLLDRHDQDQQRP